MMSSRGWISWGRRTAALLARSLIRCWGGQCPAGRDRPPLPLCARRSHPRLATCLLAGLVGQAVGCRSYCEEDDLACDTFAEEAGLHLTIVPASGSYTTGTWEFRLDATAPEGVSLIVPCSVDAARPEVMACQGGTAREAPYTVRLDDALVDGLRLTIIRDGVEPLGSEGLEGGVSGPSVILIRVLHDGVVVHEQEVAPTYDITEMTLGPETCLVCLGALVEVVVPAV